MTPTIGVMIMGDGRKDCLVDCINSFNKNVIGNITTKHIHNDGPEFSGYDKYLIDRYESDFQVFNHMTRLGLSGSGKLAWELMLAEGVDYAFWLEEDFVFNHNINLNKIIELVESNNLAQMALKRDPNNEREHLAGGWMQTLPSETFTQRQGYVEQEWLFILNPNIIPKWIMELGWPDGGGETEITSKIHQHYSDIKFGILDTIECSPHVIHTGSRRTEYWKL